MATGDKLFDWMLKMYTFGPKALRNLLTWASFTVGKMPQYHINLTAAQGSSIAILVPDQADVPHIAAHLENSQKITEHREYLSYAGSLDGVRVLVISMGYASPPVAIGVEELVQIGVNTFLFAGTGYPMQASLKPGEIILVEGAVREDGTSHQYLPASFPAVPDVFTTTSLLKACQKWGGRFHRGICVTQDVPLAETKHNNRLLNPGVFQNQAAWEKAGVLVADMAAATLFAVAQTLHKKAGCILQVAEQPEPLSNAMAAILVEGIRLLQQKG